MISAIEWVPAGVADPSPKKYEFSPAEVELIQMMEEHNMTDLQGVQAHLERQQQSQDRASSKNQQQKSSDTDKQLPADLRMDEYSSDEEDNEAVQGTMIGKLLVENDHDDMKDDTSDNVESAEKSDMKDSDQDDDEDDQSEDDDDLENVPDTREYTPVDLEGLKAIGLSQIGTNAPAYMDGDDDDDDDENDSDAEDVRIQPNDAIVVVAKTEDVSIDQRFRKPLWVCSIPCQNSKLCFCVILRTLRRWRFSFMSQTLVICLCITTFLSQRSLCH
jgi:hypothetical protein